MWNLYAPEAKENADMIFNWVYGKMSYELKNLCAFANKLVEDGKKLKRVQSNLHLADSTENLTGL